MHGDQTLFQFKRKEGKVACAHFGKAWLIWKCFEKLGKEMIDFSKTLFLIEIIIVEQFPTRKLIPWENYGKPRKSVRGKKFCSQTLNDRGTAKNVHAQEQLNRGDMQMQWTVRPQVRMKVIVKEKQA